MSMDPYQRSHHRAGLHAWVVAATAVAAIGMPRAAVAVDEAGVWGAPWLQVDAEHATHADVTGAQHAGREAGAWLSKLERGQIESALERMLLPREANAERALRSGLMQWSARGFGQPESYQPLTQRQSGHWALCLWERTDDRATDAEGLVTIRGGTLAIALYNPAGDDPTDPASRWWVVPNGYASDPALAPLFNADYHRLYTWFDSNFIS
ncbi:MAG: hypothetical protein AAGC44_05710 [Planctomycetota bacterium]